MNMGLSQYLLVSGLLFATGLFGVLLRRNVLVVYMCIELMLAASSLAAAAFSRYNNTPDGSFLVFFIITVGAAEVAVGLAVIIMLFRLRHSAKVDELISLRH